MAPCESLDTSHPDMEQPRRRQNPSPSSNEESQDEAHESTHFKWRPIPPSDSEEPIMSSTSAGNGHTSPPHPPPPPPSLHQSTPVPKPLSSSPPEIEPETFPRGRKSLSAISLRALLLGQVFTSSFLATLTLLLYIPHPIWRLPFFIATLSLFHFLEFWITARFNPPAATVSAFLLTSNGTAYNVAHTVSMIECFVTTYILYPSLSSATPGEYSSNEGSLKQWSAKLLATPWPSSITLLGLSITVLGQIIRSLAMAQAGTNFNHIVQTRRRESHKLVKSGVYSWLRHPSYFGFFWWAIGTQVVMGNRICLGVYAVVLWRFFNGRIEKEEEFLVRFFGKEYLDYHARTSVGIPFIR